MTAPAPPSRRTPSRSLSRRAMLALSAASVTAPSALLGQASPGADFQSFAAACRALTGFDVIPRSLLNGLYDRLEPLEAEAVASGGEALREETAQRILDALYTGTLAPRRDGEEPARLAYADALMHAAVEDSLNVPSFCGGLPNFWQHPPEDPA